MPGSVVERDVLVFEPDSGGHQREWLQHLMRHTEGRGTGGQILWLLVSAETHRALVADNHEHATRGKVRFLSLRPLEHRLCTARNLIVSGFARWWVMRRHLRRIGGAVGVFLAIDHLSLPLALGLGVSGRVIGVLFRPSVHYSTIGAYSPRRGEKIRDLRKTILYRLMLMNPIVTTILTLDPYFPVFARTHYREGGKVRVLPDPAFPMRERDNATPAWTSVIPNGRVVFVLFGYLTSRKGVLVLLDALIRLPAHEARRIAVVLAGKIDPVLRTSVGEKRLALERGQRGLSLHIEDRWLGGDEIGALVDRADVILAPYQRFVGSSGVLLWAARAGKPVLAQDFGLVGRFVRDYRLGLAADVENTAALAAAMVRMVEEGADRFGDRCAMRTFVSAHSPDAFAATIWDAVIKA